jgi:hypothetical protein
VTNLGFAGDSGSLSDINATQGEFRSQIAALNDMMRQVVGNAAVSAGNTAQADPLNAPFTLYVNPYTGSDEFVGGAYNDFETGVTQAEIIESKLKRLEKQRLTCGFTPQRPFKTINRAVIEAAIITSKDWYTITDPAAHVDCVSIVLSTGVHTLYNDPGSSSTSLASWGTSKDPTISELIEFNPATVGGVLLPRGCSLCGPDLRKTTIRPNFVPAVADEQPDYSNRRAMLKITGTGYFFGFTFMDKIGLEASHHLLDGFHFASQAELDDFYAKTFSAVGAGADLGSALTVTRGTEYEIVGPIDRADSPDPTWDTTSSASPYIFNCSVRSNYGMGGAFMDGSKVDGLKSMVTANFTGVSLQKDMSCWQRYDASTWTSTDYTQYIAADPDNVRMNPLRLSRHISAINNAFVQEVSVFAIGHGIHHFTDLGGEITITNSNSSFGGCAALSKGYKDFAFNLDRNWAVNAIRVPLNLGEKTGNIRRIYLGVVASVSNSLITLESPLAIDEINESVPSIVLNEGYTLASGTKVWVENPLGDDWRTDFSASAWSAANPGNLNVLGGLQQSGTDDPPEINPDTGISTAVGKRIYIRRLVDTRTPAERRVSLKLNNTAVSRLPERNFVVQTDPSRAGGAISQLLGTTGNDVLLVSSAGTGAGSPGVVRSSEITLRRGAPDQTYANSTFYRAGTVVKYQGKHYQALSNFTSASTGGPTLDLWGETYVHMRSAFDPEDSNTNEAPIITLNTDTDDDVNSTDLGLDFVNGWTAAGTLREQYRSSSDYQATFAFLTALGFSTNAAHAALIPQAADDRDRDPTSNVDFPTLPTGGAASGLGNWAIEFRRPSTLRLYGHAWEWAGFLNYSKALPAVQQELGAQNKFTYYFTNDNGGRVVPQGSNEDGFNVTPRGLEDIETGATLSVDAIGSTRLDDIAQTDFPNGLTASSITVDNLVVNTTATLPNVATTTDTPGPVELASAQELRDATQISGNNDTQRNNSINANPVVVTKQGLEYWKTQNRLVSASTGVQIVYVDPVNGRDISVNDMLADPPTTTGKAVRRLERAAQYANTRFSSSTVVQYRVAPGLINTPTSITFNTVVQLYSWDYATNAINTNFTEQGPQPFMGGATPAYDNFVDVTKQPTFGTRLITQSLPDTSLLVNVRPTRLIFNEDALVLGFAWLGTMDTIVNDSVPDSYYDVGNTFNTPISEWRTLAKSDPDNALNYYLRSQACRSGNAARATYPIYGIRQRKAVDFKSTGRLYSCAFGALRPASASQTGGSAEFEIVIGVSEQEAIFRGIRIFGNIKVSSEVNTGTITDGADVYDLTKIRYRNPSGGFTVRNYRYTGFAQQFIGPSDTNRNKEVNLGFCVGSLSITPNDSERSSNYNWNNITLLTYNRTVATSTGEPDNTGWKSIGPGFSSFIAEIGRLTPYFGRQFNTFRVSSPNFAGYLGTFGRWDSDLTTATGTAGTSNYALGTLTTDTFNASEIDVISPTLAEWFKVAGVGTRPDTATYVSGLGPGDVGQNTDRASSLGLFPELNIKLRGFKRGVNVNTGRIILRDIAI